MTNDVSIAGLRNGVLFARGVALRLVGPRLSWPVSYPQHPSKEPPFPELSPCPWCGRENFRHDLTKHINPALGTPTLSESEVRGG